MLLALAAGRLRARFYADVDEYGDDNEGTRQVAAGYVCLCMALGWLISFALVLWFNPAHLEAHVLAVFNLVAAVAGFLQIRRRGDARNMLGWVVVASLASIGVLSLRHAGVMPPILAAAPALAGIIALFLKGPMRLAAIITGALVAVLVVLTTTGVIGAPSTYTQDARQTVAISSLLLSTLTLGGLAWFSNLSRDYVMEKLQTANERMSENAARSRVALEAAKVGLWDVPDLSKRRFHASESFHSITGYTGEEFNRAFEALEDFVHPDDVTSLREAFTIGRERLSRLRTDFRLKTKTRGYRWFSARARHSENPDGTVRISGSLQDINFIKAAEEALRAGRDRAREANKAKSDFIAVMSHEVRTPLNAILGSVEVLKRGDNDPETREIAGLIDEAGRGLLGLVNDLLDVSKIEAGKLEVTPAPTDLTDLVSRTAGFWRLQASAKGLDLSANCTGGFSLPVMVDAGRVRQVLSNLLSNAIKFTDRGGVWVKLSMADDGVDAVAVTIDVSDTGPGVSPETRDLIFAPFEQGGTAVSRGGTGLGLFISRRLARLMGGDLELSAETEHGSLFRFTFRASRFTGVEASEAEAAADPVWVGRRVLCVDDNETNRRIVQLLLSKFGVDVVSCASGAEAITLSAVESYDAILMDIVMPDLDGPATLARLRGDTGSRNTQTPVIALTAKLAPEDLADYAGAGFDGVAGKPIDVRELAMAMAPFMIGPAAKT